jgi:hypothetical protein
VTVWPGARDWRQLLPWASPQCVDCRSGRAGNPIASPGERERGRRAGPTENALRRSSRGPFHNANARSMLDAMRLAGIAVPDPERARARAPPPQGGIRRNGRTARGRLRRRDEILALTIGERDQIIRALDDQRRSLLATAMPQIAGHSESQCDEAGKRNGARSEGESGTGARSTPGRYRPRDRHVRRLAGHLLTGRGIRRRGSGERAPRNGSRRGTASAVSPDREPTGGQVSPQCSVVLECLPGPLSPCLDHSRR